MYLFLKNQNKMLNLKLNRLTSAFSILLMLGMYNDNMAQSHIKGIVTETSGTPLGCANILLLNAKDSAFIKGEIAEDDRK